MKLNLRSVDLNLLTIFDAIFAESQMSKAAKRLHMTQPAVSHALTRLRATFDDELFVRTRQGMRPTPRAEELSGPIRDVLAIIQDTLDPEHVFNPEKSDRVFTIDFGRYGELNMLPLLLNQIHQSTTAISVISNAQRGEVSELLKNGDIDFYIDFQLPEDEHLETQQMGEEELVLIARKDHPRISDSLTAEDYFREKHIVLAVSEDKRELLQRVFAEQGGERSIMAEINQYIGLPTLVMQTDGIATVPRKMAEFPLYQEALNIYPLPIKLPPIPYYLIWHKAMNRDKGHQWMKQLILDSV